ncbi:uncharacterized protein E0L32_000042 [Thyridium curvatum]|uniref:J domain-containing protein n=1 Tax=Thyridium curvatum TaxID=1093900 RepID=A0A507BG76_9PEZI|nr:uncharacterized protein E0L32_000042 [Thyridium curvatum]TPX15708.1 hypothetical protein E0L32_000042 [Thyridium curvatum]
MSNLLSLIGWTFLPNLVTGWVQTILYSIFIRAGDPKPQPGTPRWAEHRRRLHILVVSLYLAYTVYEADYELRRAGSFYADLSLPLSATERDVRARFRRLAALHHPDKTSNPDAVAATAFFVHLKTAADTLADPAKRFAYERFGPDVVAWAHCATVRDYVMRGAQVLVPYYAVGAAAMYALGLLGYLDWGRYWRWLALAGLLVFELHTVTRPSPPALFDRVVNPLLGYLVPNHPPYLPFQAISLARKVCLTLYIALSQIGPMLTADTSGGRVVVAQQGGDDEALLRQGLERLEAMAKSVDQDAQRLLEMELTPFSGDPEVMAGMRAKMKEWLVQNTIRADPMVRDALGQSFKKRRIDAPSGARGTK